MQVRRRKTIVLAAVTIPVLIVATLLLYRFVYLGIPLLDEWHCSEGEAPFDLEGGGRACSPDGSELPAGAAWDPLGNRPFSCDSRRGWTVIHRDGIEDCLRDGIELPAGWARR